MCRPDLIPEGTRVISNLQIGRALTGEMPLDPPVMSMMCWNSNPVTQAPETDKIVRGLMREDLFMVSAEHFISDTASYADILLPAAMGAEMEDMILSWGHLYLTYNTKCAEAPGEAIPNNEIFRQLAARLGFEEENFKWTDAECLEHYVDWSSPACEGIDLAYMRAHGFARLKVGTPDDRAPHRGKFPHSHRQVHAQGRGRHELRRPALPPDVRSLPAGRGARSPAGLCRRPESHTADPELAKRYPLNIVSPKSHYFLNSCYANMEDKQKGQGEQFVMISPHDAGARDIVDGDRVQVGNGRGAFKGVARVTDDVKPGIVVATLGYWRQLNEGTVNSISSAAFTDMGHAPSFSDNLVEVSRAN